MRKIVTCIAAGLLVVGATAVGQAQDSEREQRGAKQQSNRGADRGAERRQVDRGGERRRAVEQQAGERRRAADQANERRRAADQNERRRAVDQANERRRAADQANQRKRAVDQANERRRAADQASERKRTADQASERKRAADQANERKRAADQANERKRAVDQANERKRAADQANERKRAADQASERKRAEDKERAVRVDAKRGNPRFVELRRKRLQLAGERRQRLRSAFHVDRRARIANARFERRIGHRIPRSVRLFLVPAAVVSIFPEYHDYRYVVVEDDVYIVDPGTYEIVDVIDDDDYAPPAGASQTAQLTLTPAQAALVLDSIPPDFPEADVRLRLALGAEIPPDVQLNEFAPIVLDNVPRLRDLRFIVAEGSVVIVDPRDRSIELVLER